MGKTFQSITQVRFRSNKGPQHLAEVKKSCERIIRSGCVSFPIQFIHTEKCCKVLIQVLKNQTIRIKLHDDIFTAYAIDEVCVCGGLHVAMVTASTVVAMVTIV